MTEAESDIDTIRCLDRAWNEAYLRNDRSVLAELLADDFRGFFPDGRSIGKAQLLQPAEPRFVRVYSRRAGRWQAVAVHVFPLEPRG